MSKIEELRERAYQECSEMLRTKGTCALVRPTGFGKTGILTKLIKDYNNVVYVYPAEVIRDSVLIFYYRSPSKVPKSRSIKNVTFMSYMALAVLDPGSNIKDKHKFDKICGADLIIFDECHRIGAEGALKTLDRIIEANPNIKMIGATATPERTDLIDEIARYFGNNFISEYTLHDAFKDNILMRPYYYYCNHRKLARDMNKVMTEAKSEVKGVAGSNNTEFTRLNANLVEISHLYSMPGIIKQLCNDFVKDTSYMRFICFFSTHDSLKRKKASIKSWFKEAYPDHKISVMEVSSRDDSSRENAVALKDLKPSKNKIDLILSCNMLNMGYHVDSITGIIMLRGTKSGIVYTQQLGRILSSSDTESKLCIDIVDNIHCPSNYTVFGSESAHTKFLKERRNQLALKKAIYQASCDILSGVLTSSKEVIDRYPEIDDVLADELMSASGDELMLNEWSESDEREHKNISVNHAPSVKVGRNTVSPEDLQSVSYEATYRELIRKTVAEARSMRARQAWARWLEQGGNPLDQNGVPLTRGQILKLVPPDKIPLPPFCYAKQVSVEAVLDEMGIT